MSRLHFLLPMLLCAVLVGFGCAGDPVSTDLATERDAVTNTEGRALWGFWEVSIDRASGEIDIIPVRDAMFNANVQQFLSPPFVPVHQMQIQILPSSDLGTGYVECSVSLTHPFLGLNQYKGFDVRGIFMADGTRTSLHDPVIMYGCEESGEAYMLNPDGYTRWWNSYEFNDSMPLLSYKPGKLGSLLYPIATLNPYKYFADDLELEQDVATMDTSSRGVFAPTTSPNLRIYQLQFPVIGSQPRFLFNYAVDASWEEPDPSYEPDYPLEAYGPGAQCQEAYHVAMNDEGSDAWYFDDDSGGSLILNIEVFDWQGAANVDGVPGEVDELWVESDVLTDAIDILPLATASPGGPTSSVFTVELTDMYLNLTESGNFNVLGSVVSTAPDSYQPQIPGGENFRFPDGRLAAYFMGTVHIGGDPGITGPVVDSIDPDEGFIDFTVDTTICGEGFVSGATVELVWVEDDSLVIAGEDVVFVDETELTCSFNLDSFTGDAELGFYDVVVTNPNLEFGTLESGFEVIEYPCAPNEWGDNFDSYSQGQYPSNGWVNFWSGSPSGTYVTAEQCYSSPMSFRLEAYTSWARYDGIPFTAGDKTYVCYEMRVMLTHVGRRAKMGFAWKKTSSTTGHYATVTIGEPYYMETYTWYHVLARINMEEHKMSVWVDDELWRDNIACGDQTSHDSFTHFFVGIGNFTSYPGTGVVYYDDVYLYWED